jgi:hypothetical protein
VVSYQALRRNIASKINHLYAEAQGDEEHVYTIGRYYPADAGKCMRRTFFKYATGAVDPMKLSAKGRNVMSLVVERMYLDVLEKMGYKSHVKISRKWGNLESISFLC